MKKRWIVGGVLAVLLGVSATGIAVNAGWLGGRWDASHAATDLAAKLQRLDGVASATATYDPLGLPEPTLIADVAFAADASPQDWSAATALVRSAASAKALAGTTSTADFHQAGSKAAVTVQPMLFAPATIAAEIAAWDELRLAVGDRVSLHLGRASENHVWSGQLTREYTIKSASDVRAVAARWPETPPAVNAALPTSWSGPGLQLSGMPSKAMMTTLSAVGAVVPLGSNEPRSAQTGLFAVVLPFDDGYKVTMLSLGNGTPVHGEPNERMARAAQAAFDTGATAVEWQSADGIRSLISGDCGSFSAGAQTIQTSFHASRRDEEFAAQLARVGFVQPPEVRAGDCR